MKLLGTIQPWAHEGGSVQVSEFNLTVTHGRGIEIITSYSERDSLSSSYSILTSHVPSFDGDGQQLTVQIASPPNGSGAYRNRRNILESGT